MDMSGSFYWTLTIGDTLGGPQPLEAPVTGHLAMGMSDKSFNGWLEGWSARGLAHGTTPGQHKASQAAPGTALQISVDA